MLAPCQQGTCPHKQALIEQTSAFWKFSLFASLEPIGLRLKAYVQGLEKGWQQKYMIAELGLALKRQRGGIIARYTDERGAVHMKGEVY